MMTDRPTSLLSLDAESGFENKHQSLNRTRSQSVENSMIDNELITDVGELMFKRHGFINGKRVYHLAIIDYLQEWNFAKKIERFTKTQLLGKDKQTLSAIEPEAYASRFRKFMI